MENTIQIYYVVVFKEDSTDWDIFMTRERSLYKATKEARKYLLKENPESIEKDDHIELYNITNLKVGKFTLTATEI